MNRINHWLFRKLLTKIDIVLIGETADTKEPVIHFMSPPNHSTSIWLERSKVDDSAKIRTVTPY